MSYSILSKPAPSGEELTPVLATALTASTKKYSLVNSDGFVSVSTDSLPHAEILLDHLPVDFTIRTNF